ncbi:MAG: hypothetical protein LBC53_09090 [Spirochaetaceae bacterium]|nr:hypothetical protein [Spirochaetaceae bacterium]
METKIIYKIIVAFSPVLKADAGAGGKKFTGKIHGIEPVSKAGRFRKALTCRNRVFQGCGSKLEVLEPPQFFII